MLLLSLGRALDPQLPGARKQGLEGKRQRGWIRGPWPVPVQIDGVKQQRTDQPIDEHRSGEHTRLGRLGAPGCLYVKGKVLGREVDFLFDTGASCTVIGSQWWMRIPPDSRPVLEESDLALTTVGNHSIPVWGKTTLKLEVGGQPVMCEVTVVQILSLIHI